MRVAMVRRAARSPPPRLSPYDEARRVWSLLYKHRLLQPLYVEAHDQAKSDEANASAAAEKEQQEGGAPSHAKSTEADYVLPYAAFTDAIFEICDSRIVLEHSSALNAIEQEQAARVRPTSPTVTGSSPWRDAAVKGSTHGSHATWAQQSLMHSATQDEIRVPFKVRPNEWGTLLCVCSIHCYAYRATLHTATPAGLRRCRPSDLARLARRASSRSCDGARPVPRRSQVPEAGLANCRGVRERLGQEVTDVTDVTDGYRR